jgi:molybdopterin-guanine dinucleotide biosynthesis protein A
VNLPLGLVLAGGRALRFGAEKAVAPLGGEPMITGSIACLATACAEVAVNAPAGSGAAAFAASRGLTILPDAAGDPAGPLAGVAMGLRWAKAKSASRLVTVPCDTPRLPPDLVARLISAPQAPVVAAETADGPHPLCALWSVDLLVDLEALLAAGRHGRVQDFLADRAARYVRFDEAAAFANINTPAELAAEGQISGSSVPA